MRKKPSAKKRRKSSARQQRQPKAKSRPRIRTDAYVTEDQVIGAGDPTQSGDTQGLSGSADADSESVKELVEEGQYLEAEAVEGVENAPDADAGPIKTREVPENDVPEEYRVPDRERQS